jgi:hypothetical protein
MSITMKSVPIAGRSTPPHRRRTATAVLAGEFDEKPPRDVLTSVLNGVPVYEAVEIKPSGVKEESTVVAGEHGRRRANEASGIGRAHETAAPLPPAALAPSTRVAASFHAPSTSSRQSSGTPRASPAIGLAANGRPAIHMITSQRSRSVTPPPPIMPPSPISTPEPSMNSSSRASSKRPRTPDDDEELDTRPGTSTSPLPRPPKRRRAVARKGWKGWVEGSPPPSEKLINLDHAVILTNRRTRSGRNLDS